MGHGRRAPGAVAVVAVVTLFVLPATAGPAAGAGHASPTASASTSAARSQSPPSGASPGPSPSVPNGPGGDEQQPTDAEIAAEQARAQALLDEVDRRATDVAQAQTALDQASQAAALALEQYSGAVLAARTAQLEADRHDQLLLQAQLTLAAQKAILGRWAREAYGEGDLASNPALITILDGGSTDDLGRAITYLQHVGDSKSRAVEGYAQAVRDQAAAASAAQAAQAAAFDARAAAEAAKKSADDAVTAQRTRLTTLQTMLASAQDAAADAERKANNLRLARALARARSSHGPNVVTGTVGDCRGSDVSIYANGRIPISALCPLWGTAGHYLRADAAYAFNRLSQAYAQQFGEPICVTDSYRDYDTQVRLFATKPNLAAVPGTSNHGWGTATDLCGGIEDFGTTTHDWMLRNAPQFGWFHPAWAEPSGSRPEPWHWEFAG